ncbi:MAG TPA: RHS repeat-associated core domain-containing protein [Cyclobacteriaceae bacterium]|nr:RHS repeat-associated core domain-containing protein [Cyclobacteriaceae bacterium]
MILLLVVACVRGYAQTTIPGEIKIQRDATPNPKNVPAGSELLLDLAVNDLIDIFPTCAGGDYYVGLQLVYDLGDSNTENNWEANLSISLMNGTTALWTQPLSVRTLDQTFLATVFHNTFITCNTAYKWRVTAKTLTGTVPQNNIYAKVLLYKKWGDPFSQATTISLSANYLSGVTNVGWTHADNAVLAYDLEWVFVADHEGAPGSAAMAFATKEPVRITTGAIGYTHLTYYPDGKIWYRIRAIGYNPQYPEHRILGNWFYSPDAGITIANHNNTYNWQQQTVFAEDGKYKKIMSYYDGTLRQRQVLTNLSTENITLVGETFYDFEGRQAVSVLPVPATDASLIYKPGFNVFAAIDGTVTSTATGNQDKFHFDNAQLNNSPLATTTGAGRYYSNTNSSTSLLKDYIPNAAGYVYSQSSFLNDPSGRISQQSGVGSEFKMDGGKITRYFYGSTTQPELTRLFGTNVGNAAHYKKNLVVDPNGQVSVSYLDQEERVIATALAGAKPDNVEALPSLIEQPITVDLSTRNQKSNGISSTTHTILNTKLNTSFTFNYNLSALASELETFGCKSCIYDLLITLSRPDGSYYNFNGFPGNTVSDGKTYQLTGITAASCSTAYVQNVVLANVVLGDIGDYTITKTLTPREMTFEEAYTLVEQTDSIQLLVEELVVTYPLDSADCEICTSCEAEDLIDDTISEIAALDCENIVQQIIQVIKQSPEHVNDPFYEPTQAEIEAHEKYCEYELCAKNELSDAFERQLARYESYSAAFAGNSTDLINIDPFFNNSLLSGFSYKTAMQGLLNSITLETASGASLTGTLLQVTDPANTNFYVDSDGNADTNGSHMLYFDLMEQNVPLNNPQYDERRWTLYRSFYLEAKRKVKINNITEYQTCPPAFAMLQLQDEMSDTEQWLEDNAEDTAVSEPEVSNSFFTIQFACDAAISPADSTTIVAHLTSYFNTHPDNVLRVIVISHLTTDPDLVAIQNILTTYGCGLSSVAQVDPFECLSDTTIVYNRNAFLNGQGQQAMRGELPHQHEFDTEFIQNKLTEQFGAYNQRKLNDKAKSSKGAGVPMSFVLSLPSQEEYNALMDLYASTNGPNWTNNSGWSTANPSIIQDVSSWYGVTTNAAGHVIALDLDGIDDNSWATVGGIQDYPGNNLVGTLPESLGDLAYLTFLNLGGNQLTGAIPASLGNITNLNYLVMADNQLTGPIPSSIGQCVNLYVIFLDRNQIGGSIPSTIENFPFLWALQLEYNQLTGSIPPQLFNLPSLQYLHLHFNQLSGTIPTNAGNMTALRHFEVNNNNLSGLVPASLSTLNLTWLWFNNNQLSGPIPVSLGSIPNLQYFMTSNNRFTFSDFLPAKAISPAHTFTYTNQAPIDRSKIISADPGQTVTLTTNIDRSTTPASLYQWYKDNVSLGAPSTSGHTLTLSNAQPSQSGTYHYQITNPNANLLTLVSRPQTVLISDSLKLTKPCLQYDTTNVALGKFKFVVNWTEVVARCEQNKAKQDSTILSYAVQRLIEEKVTEFFTSQTTTCLENATETFNYAYSSGEYHYTLYYYDQSGNLLQTVPPEGVQIHPLPHKLVTQYQYNSLNQLVWQKTPDAGESRFWYDSKSQLRLSQNAQQTIDGKYSYTKYDEQGRITEVGELYTTVNISTLIPALEDPTFPVTGPNYALHDVTKTYYDFPSVPIQATFPQKFLRTRVSWTEVHEKNAGDVITTYYSYDEHGNVHALLQTIPGMTPKRTDYKYDLVSGKVNFVLYQYGEADQFIHKYTYDSDNRIKEVFTSTDGFLFDRDAEYKYYQHGPLARVVLGEYTGVQGLDYYYTLQGWIKGVNMPYASDPSNDGNNPSKVGRDVMAYALGYYEGDYAPINNTKIISDSRDHLWTRYGEMYDNSNGYYNGNIAWMQTDLKKIGQETGSRVKGVQAMLYRYDQLHRIIKSRSLTSFSATTGFATRTGTPAAYDEDFTYDANGNLETLQRMNQTALQDNFTYDYYANSNKLRYVSAFDNIEYAGNMVNTNKLYRNVTIKSTANVANGSDVEIRAIESIYIEDGFNLNDNANMHAYVLGDNEGEFNYDAIGNLVWDQKQGVRIAWTPYGKVRSVTQEDGTVVSFRYDAAGNRIEKKRVLPNTTTTLTRYVRDASGNVMAIYTDALLTEQPIYGSSRVGQYKGGRTAGIRKLGTKQYELSNHLGNVLAVVKDNIRLQADSAWAQVVSATDYYAFGGSMPGRMYQSAEYRYGFNGKEKDDNGEWGDDTNYDYGFRIYNPRIAKFLSVDPLTRDYPWYTPYQFAGNMPIWAIDVDGLEDQIAIDGSIVTGPVNIEMVNKQIVRDQVNQAKQAMRQQPMRNPNVTTFLGPDPSKGDGAAAFKYNRSIALHEANMKKLEGNFTPLDKAMQLGVDIGSVAETGYGLYKLARNVPKYFKSFSSFSRASGGAARLAEDGINIIDAIRNNYLPGSKGAFIGETRLSEEAMRALSNEFGVEFAQVYTMGSGRNGGGGYYTLYSGTQNSVDIPKKVGEILINHTHPGGTIKPSTYDVQYLIDIEGLGSPQRSSIILPKDQPAVKFDKNTKTSNK